MTDRIRRALPALIGFALFVAALGVLATELRTTNWEAVRGNVAAMPLWRLGLALALTILNYAVLTGYDLLAFATIGRALPRARVMLASFLAFAIANNVGFAMLSGASVRYRFYTRWGIKPDELSRIVLSYSVTFWIGLFSLGGLVLAIGPLPETGYAIVPRAIAPIGWLLMAASVGYIVATLVRRRPIMVGRFALVLPPPHIAVTQLVISVVDWLLVAGVLYVLLPASDLTWPEFVGSFLAAMLAGMASHVPGGTGVFEGLMVLLLRPHLSSAQLLPAFIVYRAVYYLVPLAVAAVVLVADEMLQRRALAARVGAAVGQVAEEMTPRLLAAFTFISGIVLLLSGATPAAAGRLSLVGRVFPLSVIEVSRFAGSIIGVALLFVSQGLARRLDVVYYFTSGAIIAGIAAVLLRAFDYEEAALLALVLLLLWRARPAFNRPAAFFDTRFSADWVAALAATVSASIWLGFFAFKHVDYRQQLWWQFELHGEASRFLRASVGAAVALLLFGLAWLMRRSHEEFAEPTDTDLADAAAIISTQPFTIPNLAYLRDKSLIFSSDRTAFVMYGVQGSSWVALGDPVGSPDRFDEVIRLFVERCGDFDGTPVFYEIAPTHLHRYADLGLTFVKLGEEARVDLETFSLSGSIEARHRHVLRRLDKEGGTFRVVGVDEVPSILPQLKEVSDDWRTHKAAGEKGFSLGFFDEDYLRRFPVGVIEKDGRIRAFANIWIGGNRAELSVDLMRYHRSAPPSSMEALILHLMLWGQTEHYHWFGLGMAPLAGMGPSPIPSHWNRIGAFLFEHAEPLYNFQGVRAFKERFHPTWEPRYLAYPGGLKLPIILADIAALIAGGYRDVFRRSGEARSPDPRATASPSL